MKISVVRIPRALPVTLFLLRFLSSALADEKNICEKEMLRVATENQIPLGILYGVALAETGQTGELHAYAVNVGGKPVFSANLADALEIFDAARKNGVKLIDIGCMQINHYFHGNAFVSVSEMFDPRRNVEYAALFLKKLRQAEGSWTGAVARYHAGPGNAPAQKSYICSVIRHMVASGFGDWTDESRSFCDS